jgi:O-antigen/teichoic acid export membrane protein
VSAVSDSGGLRLVRRNALGIYGAYAAAIVSGIVVTPIVVSELGTEAYGIWSFVAATTVFLSLLDFGVGPSVVRFGAEYRGRGDSLETNALASVGLVVYAAVGALTAVLGVVLAWLVPVLVSVPDDLVWPARVATLLVVVGLVARAPLGLFLSLLLAQQRFDVVNLANLASIALYAILVVGVLTQTGGLVLLAFLALVAKVVQLALPLPWVRRELPDLRLSRALVTRERLRRLTAFSAHTFLIQVARRVVFSADVIVVGIVLGAVAAGLYGVPAKLFALAAGIGTAAVNLLLPALAELEGAEEEARQRNLLLTGLRMGMALMLVVALPFVLIPDLLLEVWIGSAGGFDVDRSTPVLALLGVALLLSQPVYVLTQYLIARGRQRELAQAVVVLAVVNVALSIVLADAVGIWGVALATVVTESIAALVVIPLLVARGAGVPVARLAVAAVRPLLPALAAALVVLVGIARALDVDTLLQLAALGAVWIAVAGAAVWRLGLSRFERAATARRLLPGRAVPAAVPPADELP